MSTKTLIPILGAVVVLGALIQRDFHLAGLIVSLCAVGMLLVLRAPVTVRGVRNFKSLSRIGKVQLVTYAALLYIFVSAIVIGQLSYFLLLLILGIEYLVGDRHRTG